MAHATLIQDAHIVNEAISFVGAVKIEGDKIAAIYKGDPPPPASDGATIINAGGKLLLPGVIDSHVHFREPGLTHKGDIASESRAAVAGGVTTFFDMPNTNPQTICIEYLGQKLRAAAGNSMANYGFFFGATNDNIDEIRKLNPARTPGVKLFLGSSTGNMLVNRDAALERIFGESGLLVAVHAEDEKLIKEKEEFYRKKFLGNPDISCHPLIRNVQACYEASARAVEIASRTGARLHLLHLSTDRELTLLNQSLLLKDKMITAEACTNHLYFNNDDFIRLGALLKCNPAIKGNEHREALQLAVNTDLIDTIASDHAPHLLSEKAGNCLAAASGIPMVQHSLSAMLEMAPKGIFTLEKIVEKMSHNPAELFHIDRRGYIREGYYADLVLVSPSTPWKVSEENIYYKCRWSPFNSEILDNKVWKTFVNGHLVYDDGLFDDSVRGMEVVFRH
jgi:dihydroorotase